MADKKKDPEALNKELQAKIEALEVENAKLKGKAKVKELPKFSDEKQEYQFTSPSFMHENVKINVFDLMDQASSEDEDVRKDAEAILAMLVQNKSGIIKKAK